LKILGRIVLFSVSSLVFVAVLEVAASVYLRVVAEQPRIHEDDPLLGWKLRPRLLVRHVVENDLDFVIATNSQGLRSPELPVANDGTHYRILVLGDSMSYGHGVDVEDRFDQYLRVLRLDDKPVEVVNASVSGYGPDQELLYLSDRGLRYQPDLVLQMSHQNDLADITRERSSGRRKPRYVLTNGELELTGSPVPRSAWLRSHSYVFGYLMTRFATWRDTSPAFEPGEAKRLFVALRSAIFELARKSGASYANVLFSDRNHIQRGDLAWKVGILEAAPADVFPILDLDAAFRREPDLRALFFQYDPHWNARGHRLAGELLARELPRLVGARSLSPLPGRR
jgi:hypothetical protein